MPTPRITARCGSIPRVARSLALVWVAVTIGCKRADRDVEPIEVDPRTEAMADPAYRDAAVALAPPRPWRAEALLAPALADSGRRTPWVLILASEAAAESERWPLIDTLLANVALFEDRAAAPAGLLLAR